MLLHEGEKLLMGRGAGIDLPIGHLQKGTEPIPQRRLQSSLDRKI